MLKELNKLWFEARRKAAAWRRWARKLPHNRVRRQRIRDERGRRVGYCPPQPLPEPPLSRCFCRTVTLPSGRAEVVLSGERVEAAYRQARRPCASPEEVEPLPIPEAEIRAWYEEYCRK